MQTTLFYRTLFAALLALFAAGCTTTHHIRALGREAALYKDATVRWALLKDGSRVHFDDKGGRYMERGITDSLGAVIAGRRFGSADFLEISARDVVELALESEEGAPEKILLLVTWMSVLSFVIALIILSGSNFKI